jgi:hypothetical protein
MMSSLLEEYPGQIKLIYIDPLFDTRRASHFESRLEDRTARDAFGP